MSEDKHWQYIFSWPGEEQNKEALQDVEDEAQWDYATNSQRLETFPSPPHTPTPPPTVLLLHPPPSNSTSPSESPSSSLPPLPFFHLCSSVTQQGHGVNKFIFFYFYISPYIIQVNTT